MDLSDAQLKDKSGSEPDFTPSGSSFEPSSGNVALTPIFTGWRARLELGFERREARSVLATRRHDGPLVVQKPLYPEGDAVCHVLVIHPPNGIAGGDDLGIRATLAEDAGAVLATPGAGKWYRSNRDEAVQDIAFSLASGARLEWLPQETILYDGARADMRFQIDLAANACYLGWEILCLGHRGPERRWLSGTARTTTRVLREGRALFSERGRWGADDPLLASPVGMGGKEVCATFIGVPAQEGTILDAGVLAACRDILPTEGEGGITAMPGLVVARYLGRSTESAKNYFIELRRWLRPAIIGRDATDLRIWRT
jgi:urease accessory protein